MTALPPGITPDDLRPPLTEYIDTLEKAGMSRADAQRAAVGHFLSDQLRENRERWGELRDRLPLTSEEAHRILESASEMRAEFGSGYVCGGGLPDDAMLAYSMSATEESLDWEARADAAVRERCELSLWIVPELGRKIAPLADDDIPF